MCVLMNNIEAVRQRLDELYRDMDVDEIVQILRDNEPAPEQTEEEPHQFEVVIVSAERLLPMDTNEKSDPYVVLSHDEKELFRTKTIYANINPRWNEVYETTLTKEITYLVCVYDAEKTQSNRLCGWQYLCIDPQEYEDYMPHDVWLDLAQIGRLLLRITMKGERDDVQFFFGKTFRSLKRKEADLSGMIVDAVSSSSTLVLCFGRCSCFRGGDDFLMLNFYVSCIRSSLSLIDDPKCPSMFDREGAVQ